MPAVSDSAVNEARAALREPISAPGLWQWLRYAITARLPEQHSAWVLHDVTTRTWVLRHAARSLVLLLVPVLAVLLFLPASLDVRVLTVLNAGLPAFLASMVFLLPACERRLVRAGHAAELGQVIREKRSIEKQTTANHARRERIAQRRARRLGTP